MLAKFGPEIFFSVLRIFIKAFFISLSRSFEGYKKEMAEITGQEKDLVYQLSQNLLTALGQQPGRLIDKEKAMTSPSADVLDQVAKMVKEKG